MELKDERLNLVREMLNGIKTIKLNAWEDGFEKRVNSKMSHYRMDIFLRCPKLGRKNCICSNWLHF
jgi:hypothetical protein